MNECSFCGRLANDINLIYTTNQMAIGTFTLAVDKKNAKKLKEKGKKHVNFIRCKAFGKTAENISIFFKKASPIIIVGSLETDKYEKDNLTHFTSDIHVEKFFFVPNQPQKENNQLLSDDKLSFDYENFQAIEVDDDVPF